MKSASGGPLGGKYGQITFQPVDPSVGTLASGPIDEQGAFALTTGALGAGARPGEYKVTLQIFKSYRDLKLVSPQNYADTSTTPLSATISPAATKFEFVVE